MATKGLKAYQKAQKAQALANRAAASEKVKQLKVAACTNKCTSTNNSDEHITIKATWTDAHINDSPLKAEGLSNTSTTPVYDESMSHKLDSKLKAYRHAQLTLASTKIESSLIKNPLIDLDAVEHDSVCCFITAHQLREVEDATNSVRKEIETSLYDNMIQPKERIAYLSSPKPTARKFQSRFCNVQTKAHLDNNSFQAANIVQEANNDQPSTAAPIIPKEHYSTDQKSGKVIVALPDDFSYATSKANKAQPFTTAEAPIADDRLISQSRSLSINELFTSAAKPTVRLLTTGKDRSAPVQNESEKEFSLDNEAWEKKPSLWINPLTIDPSVKSFKLKISPDTLPETSYTFTIRDPAIEPQLHADSLKLKALLGIKTPTDEDTKAPAEQTKGDLDVDADSSKPSSKKTSRTSSPKNGHGASTPHSRFSNSPPRSAPHETKHTAPENNVQAHTTTTHHLNNGAAAPFYGFPYAYTPHAPRRARRNKCSDPRPGAFPAQCQHNNDFYTRPYGQLESIRQPAFRDQMYCAPPLFVAQYQM